MAYRFQKQKLFDLFYDKFLSHVTSWKHVRTYVHTYVFLSALQVMQALFNFLEIIMTREGNRFYEEMMIIGEKLNFLILSIFKYISNIRSVDR